MRRHGPSLDVTGGPTFNAILNGRFGDVLTRMFWMKTAGAPTPSLSPEVQPGLDVNQQDDPFLHFLRGETIWSAGPNTGAPGAGNTNKHFVVNPAGSGLMVTVDYLAFATNVASDMYLEVFQGAPAGTPAPVQNRDYRSGSTVPIRPAIVCTTAADANAVPQAGSLHIIHVWPSYSTLNANIVVCSDPGLVILKPGTAIRLAAATAVTPQLYSQWRGRYRAMAAEEAGTG